VRLVVFEPVQVLVALLADIALVRLLLLHAQGPWIRRLGVGVNDGEGSVSIFM